MQQQIVFSKYLYFPQTTYIYTDINIVCIFTYGLQYKKSLEYTLLMYNIYLYG